MDVQKHTIPDNGERTIPIRVSSHCSSLNYATSFPWRCSQFQKHCAVFSCGLAFPEVGVTSVMDGTCLCFVELGLHCLQIPFSKPLAAVGKALLYHRKKKEGSFLLRAELLLLTQACRKQLVDWQQSQDSCLVTMSVSHCRCLARGGCICLT